MRSERSGETTVRVLVVEDEKGLAESMRRGLVAEGFVVDVVHDGVSGLWAASEFSYDVAILDIMLPRLNGYDVLKHIRDRNIWTPVIMLTAKDGEYDQTDAFDLGADDYLSSRQLQGIGSPAASAGPPWRAGAAYQADRRFLWC
jgi:DNA-binding response OmpR family regulator